MEKRVKSLLLVLNFICAALSFAAPITAIHFEGLKKTKDFILQRDIKSFIRKEADEKTIHELETLLQKEEIFSEIELVQTESEAGVEITAKVKEKITFIPFPIFSVSEGSAMGGAFVLDTNAFGLKHSFVVGGYFSALEYRAIFMYGKPPRGHAPGLSVYGSIGKKNQIYVNTDEYECIDYKMFSGNIGLVLTEIFTDYFLASLSTNFGFKDFDARKKGNISSNRYVDLEPSLKFHVSDWSGVFMSTKSFEYKHESVIYTDCYIWHIFSPRILVQQPLLTDDLRFVFNANGVHSKFIPYSAYVGNSQLGVNILPTKFGTRSGVGLSAGFEYATFKTKVGLFSLYGVYQCVKVEDFDTEYKFNQGVGFGTTLYLKQIAIPAMNFGIYYNATKSTVYSRFSIGMSL